MEEGEGNGTRPYWSQFIQTEAERRRREAGVKQSLEIRLCMYVFVYVWYLELSRVPKHVAQQMRYQNVGLRKGHCLGTISSAGADTGFLPGVGAQ